MSRNTWRSTQRKSTKRKGGAKFKPGLATAKQLRNAIHLAKRKRQLLHIAHSIKMKERKMVDELADMFSAAKLDKPKSPAKKPLTHSRTHSRKSGITKKSRAPKSVVASSIDNIANLFSSMKVGKTAHRSPRRVTRRISHRNMLIANQHAREVENRKRRTAATRSMTPYERAELRKQSTMHN
jgi:hypothetical protein